MGRPSRELLSKLGDVDDVDSDGLPIQPGLKVKTSVSVLENAMLSTARLSTCRIRYSVDGFRG